jgi:hypothetical protein
MLDTERMADGEAMISPFGAAELGEEMLLEQGGAFESNAGALESPFAEAMALSDETSLEGLAMESVLGELEDEEFDEAVQGLVDEAAARHLTSSATWSSESEAPALAANETEAWIGGVASEADRLLERLADQFSGRAADTFNFAEFAMEGDRLIAEAAPQGLATEQFFKKLIKKAGKLVKGAVDLAKKGVAAVGKILPLGKIFGALRRLVQPLLKKVLQMALNRLPVAVRPIAQRLADKLFGREAEAPQMGMASLAEITEAFDARLAESLLASSEPEVNEVVAEAEAEGEALQHDPVADLDNARTRLARQLEAGTPGVSPVAEVEQFIPIVMAALPFIRTGIKIIGRDKVVRFLADKLAGLIKGHIGAQAAQLIAAPIVDVGLRMLTLEAEGSGGASAIGTEAIVATLEDTIRTVAELPMEAFADPLRLEAEMHEAFVEAAGRHIPRRLLSPNFPAVETAQDRGVWVYMPRVTRPCYRYKKFTHVFRVPISRPIARAIRFPAGDTLERRLLDGGARVWPVESEVHLYEALPGTQVGHLAAFEAEAAVGESAQATGEFEELTPEVASMLVNEPGLGARSRIGGRARRLFRVTAPGIRVRRVSRFTVRLDATAVPPALRIHLRLSERESHTVAWALGKRAHAQVVAQLRTVLGAAFRAALATRLTRHLSERTGLPVPPARPPALADKLAESMLGVISQKLPESATALGQAARDAASGLTLTFDYRFADKAALVSGEPKAPTMVIRPGWHRD